MDSKDLRQILGEFLEVISDLSDAVTGLQSSRITDTKIVLDIERSELAERVRTGALRPPKPRSLAEKVSSLREKVKSLQP
jgi:hypothetical protein